MPKKVLSSGLHLTLDGYGCNYEQLKNLDLVYQFLDHCPNLIKKDQIMHPYVLKYHGKVPENWGISGFVLIASPGGHISIHTFPERHYLSLDIFSYEEFDHDQVVAYVTELFSIARHEKNLIDRGPAKDPGPEDSPLVA